MVTLYGIVSYSLGAVAGVWFFSENLSVVNWVGLGLVAMVLISYQGAT